MYKSKLKMFLFSHTYDELLCLCLCIPKFVVSVCGVVDGLVFFFFNFFFSVPFVLFLLVFYKLYSCCMHFNVKHTKFTCNTMCYLDKITFYLNKLSKTIQKMCDQSLFMPGL